jgi:hypothetical protein
VDAQGWLAGWLAQASHARPIRVSGIQCCQAALLLLPLPCTLRLRSTARRQGGGAAS